ISSSWVTFWPSSVVFLADHLPASVARSSAKTGVANAAARPNTDIMHRICFLILFLFEVIRCGSRNRLFAVQYFRRGHVFHQPFAIHEPGPHRLAFAEEFLGLVVPVPAF